MIPTACLLFLRRLSLIKYRARTRSSEKVLMCVFIENLFTLLFDKCTLFFSLFSTYTLTHGFFMNGCSIKYDEHGSFALWCFSFSFLSIDFSLFQTRISYFYSFHFGDDRYCHFNRFKCIDRQYCNMILNFQFNSACAQNERFRPEKAKHTLSKEKKSS